VRLGERGERLAVAFLKKKGYKIVEQNFKTRIGEIDIIALDGVTLVFVEVKARGSISYGQPFEAVTAFKRRKIKNVALLYLKRLSEVPSCRFDVISINYGNLSPEVELIQDAFEV